MKTLFFIIFLLISASGLQAQSMAKNEVSMHENIAPETANTTSVAELPGYKVSFTQNKTDFSFEVISPKSENAELRLVNSVWGDVCIIHNGPVREGKNTFTLHNPKISRGTYYVISKLSSGEQFADKIIINSK
jgi:hypothetical protein